MPEFKACFANAARNTPIMAMPWFELAGVGGIIGR